jgi:integrase
MPAFDPDRQRRSEVAETTWAEVDMAARTWTLPAARAKNGRAHSVPLSDAALAIFESLPRGDGNFAVFQPVSFSREKAKLDAAMGNFPSPWGIFPSPGRFTTYAARPRPAWRALAPRRM